MVRPSFPGDTFQSDFITIQKSTQLRFLIIYKKSIFLQIAYLTYMHAKKQPDRNGLTALRLTYLPQLQFPPQPLQFPLQVLASGQPMHLAPLFFAL